MTNLRFWRPAQNGWPAESGGEFASPPWTLAAVKRTLAALRAEEPAAGWRLETRGSASDWHIWQEA